MTETTHPTVDQIAVNNLRQSIKRVNSAKSQIEAAQAQVSKGKSVLLACLADAEYISACNADGPTTLADITAQVNAL